MGETEAKANTEAESINSEKKIFKISASTLDSIDRCGQHYEYSKVLKYRPLVTKKSLDWGSLMHFMLQGYRYSRIKHIKDHHLESPFHRMLGRNPLDATNIMSQIGRIKSLTTDLEAEVRENCIEKFAEYTAYWLPRDKFEILEVEQPFSRILYEDDDYIILYEGIIDMLVFDADWGNVPYDTKTGSNYGARFSTENQLSGTCWSFESDKFVIDKVLDRKDDPFQREIHSYMDESLKEWRIDAIQTAFKAINYHEKDFFPRHRSGCSMYGGCEYYKACRTMPSNRQFQLDSFYKQDLRDFYIYSKDENVNELFDHVLGPEKKEV